jgi:hypothetical protein
MGGSRKDKKKDSGISKDEFEKTERDLPHERKTAGHGYVESPERVAMHKNGTAGAADQSPHAARRLFVANTAANGYASGDAGSADTHLQEGMTFWEQERLMTLAVETPAQSRYSDDYIEAEIAFTGHDLAARDTSFLHGMQFSSFDYILTLSRLPYHALFG